jgi:hypothetical protein
MKRPAGKTPENESQQTGDVSNIQGTAAKITEALPNTGKCAILIATWFGLRRVRAVS